MHDVECGGRRNECEVFPFEMDLGALSSAPQVHVVPIIVYHIQATLEEKASRIFAKYVSTPWLRLQVITQAYFLACSCPVVLPAESQDPARGVTHEGVKYAMARGSHARHVPKRAGGAPAVEGKHTATTGR